ncbi:phosphoadenosine phosphosulfate reductase family protein [Paracoccus sp. DMF-8]|nr:phosphoadenosine phosphosulfate reductase family protein [Paracoccus sp. DMF-8]MDF3607067.1 phosphoadenosine phosphosulfate reductase family protein [Paracoccus sp. DMF-8]
MREVDRRRRQPRRCSIRVGKDSAVMLHLARKAFYPAPPPFPLLHVDTTWKFRDDVRTARPHGRGIGHGPDRSIRTPRRWRAGSTRSTMGRCIPTCGRPKG